jgi:predicted Zn-dependent protease with MMP-like domain
VAEGSDWRELRRVADAEVRATVKRLPPPLRRHAQSLPVTYESQPNDALLAEGYAPDLLGLFVGKAFDEEETGAIDVPAQILLFLANLWEFAAGDQAVFREEVRTTYLHELGHYLGLDELDLEQRGLE